MGCTSLSTEDVNDQLEKILKKLKIIRTLALKNKGRKVRIIRDVRLKARRDLYSTSKVETAAENTPYGATTFEYEELVD